MFHHQSWRFSAMSDFRLVFNKTAELFQAHWTTKWNKQNKSQSSNNAEWFKEGIREILNHKEKSRTSISKFIHSTKILSNCKRETDCLERKISLFDYRSTLRLENCFCESMKQRNNSVSEFPKLKRIFSWRKNAVVFQTKICSIFENKSTRRLS